MVQLNCSVLGTGPGYTSVTWLRQIGQSAPISILSPTYNEGFSANGPPSYYNGFSCYYMTASMTNSMSTLEIRSVRVSDSGLYFCGAKPGQHMIYYNATYLNVTGVAHVNDSGRAGKGVPGPSETAGDGGFCSGVCVSVVLVLALLSVLLNLVLLLIIILLKHRSGQTHITVPGDQTSSPTEQARESDSLTYAALNFSKKKKKQRRTNLQTDDPHVVYAATR
ncbi:uncharacterized protein LOC134438054 [Engraulis encrasicolus]|uniref:uncharacterized protein LOC134438054 n=1 Tax=Engraulis encrasicolus TaxID=184585 RepID=UPI002FCF536E